MKRQRRKDIVTVECPSCGSLIAVAAKPPGIPECQCGADLPWGPRWNPLRGLRKRKPAQRTRKRLSAGHYTFATGMAVVSFIPAKIAHATWDDFYVFLARVGESIQSWVVTIAVNLTIVSALALAWMVVAVAVRTAWTEWRTVRTQPADPDADTEPYLDIGAWEAVGDYVTLLREKKEQIRRWAADEQDADLQQHGFDLADDYQRQADEVIEMMRNRDRSSTARA